MGASRARELAVTWAPAIAAADDAILARALAEARSRPVSYPFGSGHADELAVVAGLKPVLRQLLPEAEAPKTRARLERLALHVVQARAAHGENAGGGGARPTALFAGRDRARVQAAAACESIEDSDVEMGRLLGYPKCCAEAYVEIPPPRENVTVLRASLARTGTTKLARLNVADLHMFRYVSFIPCSFDCALSAAWADRLAEKLATRHATFVATMDAALGAHRFVASDGVQVSATGVFDGQALRVVRAWATCRDRHPDHAMDRAEDELSARIAAAIETAGVVVLESEALRVGDLRVPTRDTFLLPFGPGQLASPSRAPGDEG